MFIFYFILSVHILPCFCVIKIKSWIFRNFSGAVGTTVGIYITEVKVLGSNLMFFSQKQAISLKA